MHTAISHQPPVPGTMFVTETVRHLSEQLKGMPKVLVNVRAKVADQPEDFHAMERDYSPEQWRELLARPNTLYRYRSEPYRQL